MKKNFLLSLLALTMLFFAVSCSDDEEPTPPPTVDNEVAKVIDALTDIEGVSGFLKVLEDNALDINPEGENITVFAVKDAAAEEKSLAEEEVIGKDNLKRHIVAGAYDLSDFAADTVVVKSLSGDPIAITKDGDNIYINGALVETADATKAGENLIYVVDKVVPDVEMTSKDALFNVYEINEEWAEGAEEKALSDTAQIDFYRYVNEEYVLVGSVLTAEGLATYSHYYQDSLFYTVKKDDKSPLREGYQFAGLFTSQDQIESAPTYSTGTVLDNIELGKLRLLDINGDNVINASDKAETEYFKLDMAASKTEAIIVSSKFGEEEAETE